LKWVRWPSDVALFRTGGLYPRIVLASTLTLFCVLIWPLAAKLMVRRTARL